MKLFVALCVLGLVALVSAKPQFNPRGCVYVEGRCYDSGCKVGTHSYTPGCAPKIPEPTCDEPNPQPERGVICDYSKCYCDSPTVRDTVSDKCVRLEECPKKQKE